MSAQRLFDPGLQPERTELSWRRTALAIGVGSLLAMRVLPALAPTPELSPAWLAPGIVGLLYAVTLWLRARRRHERVTRALLDDSPQSLPGAALLAGLTLFVVGSGIAALVIVLLPFAR